jgi:recombination protein RecT
MSDNTPVQNAKNAAPLMTIDPRQKNLRALLESAKQQLAEVLPKHLTAERLIKVVLSCVARTPSLLECTQGSILLSVMQAAELGLEIGGLLGEAYLVPFNTKIKDANGREHWEKRAQCIPGYRGLVKLARQSGEVLRIEARAVWDDEMFDVELGLHSDLKHKPNLRTRKEDAKVVAAYAIARFRDGCEQFDVMTIGELEVIRKRAKEKNRGASSPWDTDTVEMYKKTILRRAAKLWPLSAEKYRKAAELDAEHDELPGGPIVDIALLPEETPSKSGKNDGLKEKLRTKAAGDAAPVQVIEMPSEALPPDEPASQEPGSEAMRQPGEEG